MDRLRLAILSRKSNGIFVFIAIFALICTPTGCQVSQTRFQMDSNSRVPFFGLDLKFPRKSDTLQEVSHIADPDAEPVVQAHLEEPSKPASRWNRWMHPLKKPQRIVLPLTDAEPDASELNTEVFAVDKF